MLHSQHDVTGGEVTMLRKLRVTSVSIAALGLVCQAYAQAPSLITQPINESNLVTLVGNIRPEANAANDRGPVPDSMPIEHMLLLLQRSQQQEQAAEALIDQLHDPSSANYHHWLTAAQFGQMFGLAQQDLNTIRNWLASQGFRVNVEYPSGVLIDFSGTAGQVRAAFHTEIHNLSVNGVPHIANMSNPQIPAALAPAIIGIVSLHNFWPYPMYISKANYTVTMNGLTDYLVVPGDLAVIYNLNPLFAKGVAGHGQTVVVVEDTDLYGSSDWTTFRSTFGLNVFTGGSLVSVNPPSSGTNNCADPGVNGDSTEAAVDAEYSSAAAPAATIEVAACEDTTVTFGGLIAFQNILNASSTPPSIMSMSYGECEAFNGASANAAFNSTFQQAVMEGVSVFVSAGDDAAAGCDRDAEDAVHGIGITGWGETPYNVSVGGTDFGDTYMNDNSTYWNATNTKYYESAKSYIPEIPWNDTCASVLVASAEGYPRTYGNRGFCNSPIGEEFLGTTGGSGGPSGCATGAPSVYGVVSGTCKGYAKPSWQVVLGNPNDGVRDIPDVSLFASNGIWGHYYPICYSDPAFGGVPCAGAPDTWLGGGGTSVSSPIMAGIQALINQVNGSQQGNPNYAYYKLASMEYGSTGSETCNSTLGNAVASSCVFYDVTLGDMDVPCTLGSGDCYKPSGTFGVLSTSDSSYLPAYATGTGWDFATGIGTVNANNLVFHWKLVAP
jgi:subtilase family serine protease